MTKIALVDADYEQVEDVAKKIGIEVGEDVSREELITLVLDADPTLETIDVSENTPVDAEPPAQEKKGGLSGKKVRIKILDSDDDANDVVVWLNGRSYQMKRNVEIDIPVEVMGILNCAIETKYKHIIGEKKTTVVRKEVPVHNVQVIGYA